MAAARTCLRNYWPMRKELTDIFCTDNRSWAKRISECVEPSNLEEEKQKYADSALPGKRI